MSDEIEIRPLAAEDAAKLSACFRRCYGDSYVAGFFYDPAEIRARVEGGRLRSVVAVTPEGEIVGHMALTTKHAQSRTVEAGNTVVDPACRGAGLAARLGAALFQACRAAGYVGFHHYPTTAHAIMQKLAVQGGGVETGVMLGYIPEGTDYKELGGKADDGRLAVVVVYQPIDEAPHRDVYLPQRWAELLAAIYDRARLVRTALPVASAFAAPSTKLTQSFDRPRSLLRVDVEVIGADVRRRVVDATSAHDAAVTHVDLLLSEAATPLAVDELCGAGFSFCAVLPEFSSADVLRLQRLRPGAKIAMPDLVYPEARAILDLALGEH